MKAKKLYLIAEWSAQNSRDYYLGQLIKLYDDNEKFAGTTRIMGGVIVSDGKAIVFSDKTAVDVSHFVGDPENITQEEKDCLVMNYPNLHIKFEE